MKPLFWTIAIGLGVGLLMSPPTMAARAPLTAYRPYAAASTSAADCYGPVGVYVSLDAQFTRTQKLKAARSLQRSQKPRGVSAKVGGKRYALRIDAKTSGVDTKRLWWNFKRVKVSKKASQRLIGKKLIVRYKLGKRSVSRTATVRPGDCGMP